MKIKKNMLSVEVIRGLESLEFLPVAITASKRTTVDGSSIGEALFAETNTYWATLSEEAKDELFELYRQLHELSTESHDVVMEHIGGIMQKIAAMHPIENFRALFPIERVWIPENLQHTFDENTNPSYSDSMTYKVIDYYELAIFTMAIKPLIPALSLLQVYDNQRNHNRRNDDPSVRRQRRIVVNRYIQAYDLLMETDLRRSPAVNKIRDHLSEVMIKFGGRDKGPGSRAASSLETVAVYCGFGTDILEAYIPAFATVQKLALTPVNLRRGQVGDSLVTSIYWAVGSEMNNGLVSKLTSVNVCAKVPVTKQITRGENNKLSSIDLVSARSPAPIKEAIRSEMAFSHPPFQRSLLAAMGIAASIQDIKALAESLHQNHNGVVTEVHCWLTAYAMHRFADHRTYKDMEPTSMYDAMAFAQAMYLNYGMHSPARLLACRADMWDTVQLGYPIEAYHLAFKEDLDRYYPQAYRQQPRNANAGVMQPAVLSVSEFIKIMNQYKYTLVASDEASRLMRLPPPESSDGFQYVPDPKIGLMLIEFMIIQSRNKLNEIQMFA